MRNGWSLGHLHFSLWVAPVETVGQSQSTAYLVCDTLSVPMHRIILLATKETREPCRNLWHYRMLTASCSLLGRRMSPSVAMCSSSCCRCAYCFLLGHGSTVLPCLGICSPAAGCAAVVGTNSTAGHNCCPGRAGAEHTACCARLSTWPCKKPVARGLHTNSKG